MNEIFSNIYGFEWDQGNINKNKEKHDIDWWVIEEIFFNQPLLVNEDNKHGEKEKRWYLLGKTDNNEKYMVVFTIRKNKIRVISARLMNKKERAYYEKTERNTRI